METWGPTEGAKYGIAIYNFDGNVNHGLKLDVGEAVQIFEGCAGWYRGCCLKNKSVKGIFPASFVQLKECAVENLGTPLEVINPTGDAVIKEVTAVLREWLELWKKLFLKSCKTKFLEMKKIMDHLINLRLKILSGVLTQTLIDELKAEITSKIDYWNSQMDLDLVPRINGVAADVDHTSVVELYRIHVLSLKESKKIEREVTMPRSSLSVVKAHRHILLSVKKFVSNTEDNLEIYFSLFDGVNEKFLSHRFVMYLDTEVLPNVADNLSSDKTKTLFTDLGRKTFASELFIVCHVVRIGEMHVEQTPKKKHSHNFRRPFACGVFNVQENVRLDDDHFGEDRPFSVPLFLCANEANFSSMHEDLIRRFLNKSSTTSATDGMSMSVSLKVFNGDRDRIICANPLWIPADICITRKLGFPDVILPGDIRNDVFITLKKGEFERGRNVEVTVSVLLSSGAVVENCIYAGSASRACSEYNSLIIYHNNSPTWNETIKLNIPVDKFHDAHVLFVFRHCPTSFHVREKGKKTFGFSFLRLLRSDGTTILDGSHQLLFYKTSLLDSKNPSKYLICPSSEADLSWVENQHSLNHAARSSREALFVSTLTCSTKLTQNLNLVGLLRWRLHKHKISEVLQSLHNVRGDEIMKFLQDILDALFAILNEEISGMLVFNNLILIINLLLDSTYQQFQAVLNTYITHHFSAALAHSHLVPLFIQAMSAGKSNEGSGVVKVAKALHYIIKFIMQSWELNLRIHPGKPDLEFKNSLHMLFTKLSDAVGRIGDGWRSTQSAILLNLPKVYKDLSTVFKDDELADLLKDLFCSARSSSLISDKLNFLDGLITTSPLFHNESSRVTLMPLVLNCLHEQLLQKNELKTCADILGNLLSCLSKVTNGSANNDVEQISKSLLEVVFQAVVTVDRTSPRAGKYVAILYTLLKMMSEDNYQSYLKCFENQKDLRDFLNKAYGVFTNLLQRNIYPDDWFVMKIEGNYVILGAVQNFSHALTDNFLREEVFDYQLWNTYFHLAICFVSHEILDLKKYSEAKRMKILEKYGDMRHVMGFELVRMWNSLGHLQSNFIPSLIAPFLEMTLVPEPVLRRETIPLFYDMMDKEMKSSGNIQKVEEEFIDKLDVFLSKNNMGDEEYKELFQDILTEKIVENRELKKPGILFVNSVVTLLERLLDYRKVISSREEYRDMKMGCIVNLLNYYEEKGKEDMFLKYVNKLYDLHISAENYIEAGFTLFLYASYLEFEDYQLTAEGNFPAQTERERKEKLCRMSIELLDKGKLWESAIRICKTLIHQYEMEVFDFIKLSEMLQLQATFYENIVKTHRVEPSYFRIWFYGKAFPSFLQNKQFVYRGRAVETIGEFCSRMEKEYPDAEVLRHNNPLDEEQMLSNKLYIQCCKVEPISNSGSIPGNVNYRISSYYDVNWIDRFQLTRPFHKGETKDKSNEFATLWCEVTTLTIETRLPGILPWFLVTASEHRELSPIENAINTVTSKTRDLQRNIQELHEDDKRNINPLSMQLKGVIDAAVNGGILNYQKAFFTPEYTRTNPLRNSEVAHLERVLLEQAGVLRQGLILHESRISPDLRPLHESMLYQYNNMLNDIPGDTRAHVLIQRKWSLPLNSSPSESTTSLDRRVSSDSPDTGTLRKLSKLFPIRKPVPLYFNEGMEGNRKSTLSEVVLKTSSSLLSVSELEILNQSVSVPDLRAMQDETRPKLPQKLRTGKQWNEEGGGASFPATSRVSVGSSISSTSLNEIDELELTHALEDDVHGPQLKIDRPTLARTPSPEVKGVLDDSVSPRIPLKKRQLPMTTLKKRQSNIFELSTNGTYRVSKIFSSLQSRSMDDLDKIGTESQIREEQGSQNIQSEENLFSGEWSDEKQVTGKDSNDNLNILDDEIPPPLYPRKRTTRLQSHYDTLVVPPNLARPSPASRESTYSMDRIKHSATLSSSPNGPKRQGNLKHRYANLDGEVSVAQQQQRSVYPSSVVYEGDPYDVLVTPSRNLDVRKKDVDRSKTLDTTPINTNIADRNPPQTVKAVSKSKNAQSMYNTVTFRNAPPHNTNGNATGIELHKNKNVYVGEYSLGSQDQTNGIPGLYEYHLPKHLPSDCIVSGSVANVVSKIENSKNTSLSLPPSIPPKISRKETEIAKQSTTLPVLRSSSPGLNNPSKYSPPVAPRIKKTRNLPKPENNNVE